MVVDVLNAPSTSRKEPGWPVQRRIVSYTRRLRQVIAEAGILVITDLIEPLAERGVELSTSQAHRLVITPLERRNLTVLAAPSRHHGLWNHEQVVAPVTVVITGLPGAGKSTLADALAGRIGAPAFAGDWLLGALRPADRVLDDLTREEYLELYQSLLLSLITRQVLLGQSSIVDCVVTDQTLSRWRAEVEMRHGRMAVIECVCVDTHLHRSRVEGRIRGIPGWHEIDWSHVERMRDETPPLTSDRLIIDAVNPVAANLERVLAYLERLNPAN